MKTLNTLKTPTNCHHSAGLLFLHKRVEGLKSGTATSQFFESPYHVVDGVLTVSLNKRGAGVVPHSYTGHTYDEETELSYMGARYYGGDRGQFILLVDLQMGNFPLAKLNSHAASLPLNHINSDHLGSDLLMTDETEDVIQTSGYVLSGTQDQPPSFSRIVPFTQSALSQYLIFSC